jgi:hypothetical protein
VHAIARRFTFAVDLKSSRRMSYLRSTLEEQSETPYFIAHRPSENLATREQLSGMLAGSWCARRIKLIFDILARSSPPSSENRSLKA